MTAYEGAPGGSGRAPTLARRADGGARPATRRDRPAVPGWLLGPLSILLGLLGWQWLVSARDIPAFILPPPGRVATRFATALADGTWWSHTSVTLVESLLGFALGFVVATVLGYLLAHLPLLERLVSPYIAASQALPVVAIAPILLLWLGFGLLPKVIVAAIVVFFPMLINTIGGLRRIDPALREVAQVYGAEPLADVPLRRAAAGPADDPRRDTDRLHPGGHRRDGRGVPGGRSWPRAAAERLQGVVRHPAPLRRADHADPDRDAGLRICGAAGAGAGAVVGERRRETEQETRRHGEGWGGRRWGRWMRGRPPRPPNAGG